MRFTELRGKLVFAAPVLFLLLLSGQRGLAADKPDAAGNLQQVLQQLDASAKNFHTASADVKIQIVQTVPVPDTDVQIGSVYFKQESGQAQTALRITTQDGQPFHEIVTYSKGMFQIYQENTNQVTQSRNAAQYAPYLMIGFGATGQDMADRFNITYLGQEKIDGVQTVKLQLIAKDPKVLRLLPKIMIWIDPTRDVSLKQYADEGQGMSRTVNYSRIELNHPIPASRFTFKTNKSTQITTQ